ncbi:MAG: S8 family serine peptidase, partial [candidate division WOR-3 bacterium]
SRGAEIVNTSLGWSDWYRWPRDFDGKTSPASIAGYEAAKRGMIIASAVGNISLSESPRIHIPSDAEGIITVGGIDSLYNHWKGPATFSGYYPTPDHSVKKPEIMSLAAASVVIDPDSTNSYLYSFGTSGATAMVSGICALLLEAHSNWTVDSVRNALFNTASHATTPSDSMGYGWPDAYAAFNFSPTDFDITPENAFLTPYPNPFIPSQHGTIYIPFKLIMSHSVELRIYSLSGRLIKTEEREGLLLPGQYTDQDPESSHAAFMWDGIDEDGEEVASGLYYCLLLTRGGRNDIVKIAVVR